VDEGGAPAAAPAGRAGDPSRGGWSEAGLDGGGPGPATVPAAGARYAVGALVGRGGMGAVRAARDTLLGRDVALKALLEERADDPAAQARLAREAAITSCLDHPGIVPVFDLGALPDGRPFYTMRLIRGRTLADVAQAAHAGGAAPAPQPLVRLVLAACEAVAAAHALGLVHRDLKPANILVGAHGEVQVVDWGLAAPTPAAAPRWAGLPPAPEATRAGTARYMAPEQQAGSAPAPAADVWALGLTLTEVVGGPSGALPPELAAVVRRATAPDPADRYADAGAMAADLLAWFEGRRVAAHSYSAPERLSRALRPYRLPLLVGAAGLAALVLSLAAGWSRSEAALRRAQAAEAAAGDRLAAVQLQQAERAALAGDREQAERLALAVLQRVDAPLARGVLAAFGRAERPARVAEAPGAACAWSALPPGGAYVICGEGAQVSRWEAGARIWSAPGPALGAVVVEAADGRALVVVHDHLDAARALDAATGVEVDRWERSASRWESALIPRTAWAPDGPLPRRPLPALCLGHHGAAVLGGALAVICKDGTLLRGALPAVDAPAASPLRALPTPARGAETPTALAWAGPDRLLIGTLQGKVFVLDAHSGAQLSAADTGLGSVSTLVAAPDGLHAAVDGALGPVALVRLDTGAVVTRIAAGRPRAVAFSDAGLVVHDGALQTWALPAGAPAVVQAGAGLGELAVEPGGARMTVVGGEGTALEVDLRDGRQRRLAIGAEVVKAAAYGPAGLALSGMGSPALALRPAGAPALEAAAGGRALRRLGVRADGLVVGVDVHTGVTAWRPPSAPAHTPLGSNTFVDLEIDGDTAHLLDRGGGWWRWGPAGLGRVGAVPGARALAVRGEVVAATTDAGLVLRDARGERRLPAEGHSLLDVALSADGQTVAAGTLAGPVLVWAVADGRLLGVLPGHSQRVPAVEFLPDGDLASVGWDGTARLWALSALRAPVAALEAELRVAWAPVGAAPSAPAAGPALR
jgi:WD40 repeat protein